MPWIFNVFLLLLAGLLGLSTQHSGAAAVVEKLRLYLLGAFTMAVSTDKRWQPLTDSDMMKKGDNFATKRIVVFRHAESEWNEIFNRGFGASFLPRLGKALWKELSLLPTRHSIFVDTPLSSVGVAQAEELAAFTAGPTGPGDDAAIKALLRGDDGAGDSVIVCSNLRRSLATGSIGLRHRLQKTGERVHIASCLQEVTFNIDGVALAGPQEVPDLTDIEPHLGSWYSPSALWDTALNAGDKPVFGAGLERMLQFNRFVFQQPQSTIIVAGGHSLYFRYFFKTFLGRGVEHAAKSKKMDNCAVLSFDLQRGSYGGEVLYRVAPDSIKVAHKGFV